MLEDILCGRRRRVAAGDAASGEAGMAPSVPRRDVRRGQTHAREEPRPA